MAGLEQLLHQPDPVRVLQQEVPAGLHGHNEVGPVLRQAALLRDRGDDVLLDVDAQVLLLREQQQQLVAAARLPRAARPPGQQRLLHLQPHGRLGVRPARAIATAPPLQDLRRGTGHEDCIPCRARHLSPGLIAATGRVRIVYLPPTPRATATIRTRSAGDEGVSALIAELATPRSRDWPSAGARAHTRTCAPCVLCLEAFPDPTAGNEYGRRPRALSRKVCLNVFARETLLDSRAIRLVRTRRYTKFVSEHNDRQIFRWPFSPD